MTFVKGISGNPKGGVRGKPHKLTAAIRKLVEADGPEIVRKVIEDARNGDFASRQLFMRHLLPRYRFTPSPVDLEPAKGADEVRDQIGQLVSMTASGLLDLDTMRTLVDALKVVIDGRVATLEEMVRDMADHRDRDEP